MRYSGLSAANRSTELALRPATPEDLKVATPGDSFYLLVDGHWMRVRVNGHPKTWKRDSLRVRVPWKYGLFEYGRFETDSTGGNIGAVPYVEALEL